MTRWQALAAAALALSALPAGAQEGNLRRFTESATDTNRSNRIIYVPLGWTFPEGRPPKQGYDADVAAWYQVPLGRTNMPASNTLEKAEYRLERFEELADRPGIVRVVITRRPGAQGQPVPADAAPPMLGLVEPETYISTQALPSVERTGDVVRLTYTLPRPDVALLGQKATLPAGTQRTYELRLKPAREVQLPRYITRAPTFGGEDLATRSFMAPPSTPITDRVAGRRQETRGNRDRDNKRDDKKERRDRK